MRAIKIGTSPNCTWARTSLITLKWKVQQVTTTQSRMRRCTGRWKTCTYCAPISGMWRHRWHFITLTIIVGIDFISDTAHKPLASGSWEHSPPHIRPQWVWVMRQQRLGWGFKWCRQFGPIIWYRFTLCKAWIKAGCGDLWINWGCS